MDQTALDKRYGEDGKRTNIVLHATKQDTGLEIAQTKKNRHGPSFLLTWIHTVMN